VLSGTTGVQGAGNALENLLRGNDGSNRLLGQDGEETLAGGAGNDSLTGGAGAGASAALTVEQRTIYDQSTGALYYDEDGVGGVAAVQFAVLGTTSHPALEVGDFVVLG
jgi:Ca2+-binding RTX toxin-like protein